MAEVTLGEFQSLGFNEPCGFWSHPLGTLRPPYCEEAQSILLEVERSHGGELTHSRQQPAPTARPMSDAILVEARPSEKLSSPPTDLGEIINCFHFKPVNFDMACYAAIVN